MTRCDALVVGGGPAGSTCAGILRRAGWDVIVADRARFPRDKVCAGWLTPDVFRLLELDPWTYAASGLTLQEITSFRTGVMGRALVETSYPSVVSYAIRRCEFDAFLLKRARVRVLEEQPVETFRRGDGAWVVDERIETPIVIGAGGHFCPVARHMRGGRDAQSPVVAKETEFRVTGAQARWFNGAPSLFFCRDLQGYGWVVTKGPYVNIGLGRRESSEFGSHLRRFIQLVEERAGTSLPAEARWRGHAYFAAGAGTRPLAGDGMLLVGDAAGLAFPESGEGIKPAIASGRLAAEILAGSRRPGDAESLEAYAAAIRRLHPPVLQSPAILHRALAAVGRLLLGSRSFTRHFVLNRWFLRATSAN